ncbi:hypothetical protein NDS46_28015 [Paenibacillus thiaminolyticus]|uniref:hypothetical protein n=1 Tax=Paenibacillus thiaminolyticus TaxID=49283 RepID=UPI00232BA5FC|nr:hypothetical protein [Paenibacillus thiaminolyticus]WCF08060.1 hypothetical protein NDS46_28015 [Paenibacillus thiaminolyticus]
MLGSKKAPLIGALTLSITYAHAWRQIEPIGAFHARAFRLHDRVLNTDAVHRNLRQ